MAYATASVLFQSAKAGQNCPLEGVLNVTQRRMMHSSAAATKRRTTTMALWQNEGLFILASAIIHDFDTQRHFGVIIFINGESVFGNRKT